MPIQGKLLKCFGKDFCHCNYSPCFGLACVFRSRKYPLAVLFNAPLAFVIEIRNDNKTENFQCWTKLVKINF